MRSGCGLSDAATYRVPRGAVPRDPVPAGSSHPCTIALLPYGPNHSFVVLLLLLAFLLEIRSPFPIATALLVVMHPSWGGGIPLLSSARTCRAGMIVVLCYCLCHPWKWHPNPSVALILSCPIGLGHCRTRGTKPSALCIVGWPRRFRQWQEADAISAIRIH